MLGLEMPASKDIRPSKRACRCLFGIPNRDELKKTLQKETEEIIKADQDKWEFDFVSERPVLGAKVFEWLRIPPSEQVSKAYEMPHLDFTRKRKRADSDGDILAVDYLTRGDVSDAAAETVVRDHTDSDVSPHQSDSDNTSPSRQSSEQDTVTHTVTETAQSPPANTRRTMTEYYPVVKRAKHEEK